MKFRPCIDLHDGQVKQIVGSTLRDSSNSNATEAGATNFSTSRPASEFAAMYKQDGLTGGHVIMLGPNNTEAAKLALSTYRNGLQIGGGINHTNCVEWLEAGASHVIVTSHVFDQGEIHYHRLQELVQLVGGKQRLVLDLSCRKKPSNVGTADEDKYYVVTNKWQTFTNVPVDEANLRQLSQYCDEFLVHGVDVEGLRCGVLTDLIELLGKYSPIPVTYAGGVRSLDDLNLVKRVGGDLVDCTVGSALDIFGGDLPYDNVVQWHYDQAENKR
jgi:phosphoribosylformimino-5-aminoimidazole carboxamide ribotide isomerase